MFHRSTFHTAKMKVGGGGGGGGCEELRTRS